MPLYDVPRFPLRCSRLDRLALRATLALSKWIWPAAVTGTEHIPGHDRYIVCPNHETVMDNFWVLRHLPAAHRPKVFAVFKQEHLQTGRGRYFSRLLNGVPIDRAGNSLPTLSRCEELLRQNRILMVFPEGTRTRTGTLQSFKTGAARLAITTGKLLLPVRIEGGFDAWPFGQKASFLRGRSLRVAFGAPIDPSGKTEEEVTDALRQAVASL